MGRALNVLLVEDSSSDEWLLREAVREQELPLRMTSAPDGASALDLLRGEAYLPDLILLDLNLPRLDGQELLKALKLEPRLRSIPVLVLTTSARAKDVEDCYALQASAFITKPRDLKDLYQAMANISRFWADTATLPGHARP